MRYVAAILLVSGAALAQEALPTKTIDFTDQEEKILLQSCGAAEWANRIAFQGLCDFMKNKFAGARPYQKSEAKK